MNAHSKKSSYFKSCDFPVMHNVALLVVFLSIFGVSVYGDRMEVTFGESSTFSSYLVDYQKPLIRLTLPSF